MERVRLRNLVAKARIYAMNKEHGYYFSTNINHSLCVQLPLIGVLNCALQLGF